MVVAEGRFLERCVAAVRSSDVEIVIACAGRTFIPQSLIDFGATVVRSPDDTPIALAARGIAAATGDVICLTEDHCVPSQEWAASLVRALSHEGVIAAGGPIAMPAGVTSFDWAFHIVDFYRYLPPVRSGPVSSLSICNVAYPRPALDAIQGEWQNGFHETRVNDMLRSRGILEMTPNALVTCDRRVSVADGMGERFRFGQLFAARRFPKSSLLRRLAYAAGAIALPLVLLTRIARRCCMDPRLLTQLLKSAGYVMLLLFAWAAGEFIGYVTARPPGSSVAARNREDFRHGEIPSS